MGHIAPSCNMAIPTVAKETEIHGGRALATPAKKKEAMGRGEWGIWLFSDLYAPLLHSLILKLPYSNGIFFFFFFNSALPSEVFKCFSVLPLLFSIYYTHCFFFFSTHASVCISTK